MDPAASSENVFMLYSLGMGIAIPFMYDLVKIIRNVCHHNSFFLFIEEVLFWVFCAVSVFYVMQTKSNGTIRWFAVLGGMIGIGFYKKTISNHMVDGALWCLNGIKNKLTVSFKLLKMKVTGRH